jgi:hypothetical protein
VMTGVLAALGLVAVADAGGVPEDASSPPRRTLETAAPWRRLLLLVFVKADTRRAGLAR